ncbi:PIG-L family deacetylase [Paenactinomyces guangxiensis]|uniref:PIG-L family deacetylase n=1 Tax=Paenactinomyces guangxiensis TaxID=1490290 RepID=A0A7W2A8B7_9BACL|nr:PIG-L family deacetylase [Paenactinomyces guangxiensis]MBA4493999.1 PIG-L family deacetylase [Paenactinomyces guangxiensis]MBH8591256.1 PIG-L family deacetylase [Paenactinomyces guangxiensis]
MYRCTFLLLVILLTAILPLNSTSAATRMNVVDSSTNVVVYFSPHADDEALTFSVPILNDVRSGKKVYLILMSAGDKSGARDVVNGMYDEESRDPALSGQSLYCKWHQKYHHPAEEGYMDGWLTKEKFGQARIREFYKSAEAMGIPKDRVKINLLANEEFTYNSVKSIISLNSRLFPNAQFKSFSAIDGHADHAMVGRVLNDMYKQGQIKKPQTNYVSIYTDRFSQMYVPGYKLTLTNSQDLGKLKNALNVYKTWSPREGFYALGYHSVPVQFDAMENDPYTKVSRY